MFIHIGYKKIISDRTIVGIFNRKTLELSEKNEVYLDEIKKDTKSVLIDEDDEVILSIINSVTLINRNKIDKNDLFWSRRKM